MPEAFIEKRDDKKSEAIKEEFKSKQPISKMTKKQNYTAFSKRLSSKQIFSMLSKFKGKLSKGFAALLKKILG